MSALILMSTYNGERFLADQINSIIQQTVTDWTLLIRDDESTDNTKSIIQSFVQKDPRIQLISDNEKNLKSCYSFGKLMQTAINRSEPYIFFCDQDDIWLPEKLNISINALRQLEEKHGELTPGLVHTDLQVVDENLNTINHSFLRQEGLHINKDKPLHTLIINNYVTGCTIGINRALLKLATPIPSNVIMHDWWCALCAAATGHITSIKAATVLYRQHQKNTIGSRSLSTKLLDLITNKKGVRARTKHLRNCFLQTSQLLNKVSTDHPYYPMIEAFTHLPALPLLSRYHALSKLRLRPASWMRKVNLWLMLCML